MIPYNTTHLSSETLFLWKCPSHRRLQAARTAAAARSLRAPAAASPDRWDLGHRFFFNEKDGEERGFQSSMTLICFKSELQFDNITHKCNIYIYVYINISQY